MKPVLRIIKFRLFSLNAAARPDMLLLPIMARRNFNFVDATHSAPVGDCRVGAEHEAVQGALRVQAESHCRGGGVGAERPRNCYEYSIACRSVGRRKSAHVV